MKRLPLILSIPHCSKRIPAALEKTMNLTDHERKESIDWGTLEIFGSLPSSAILCAEWSRLVVDLNRDPGRRDRAGVVPYMDYNGRMVYRPGYIPGEEEIRKRIENYYTPYHDRLKNALANSEIRGIIDCHSLCEVGPAEAPDAGGRRKDIVLGNNGDSNGKEAPGRGKVTAPAEIVQRLLRAFQERGFSVSMNDPYPGGYITRYYGQNFAENGRIFLQIEINQGLYIDRETNRMAPARIKDVQERVHEAFQMFAQIW